MSSDFLQPINGYNVAKLDYADRSGFWLISEAVLTVVPCNFVYGIGFIYNLSRENNILQLGSTRVVFSFSLYLPLIISNAAL